MLLKSHAHKPEPRWQVRMSCHSRPRGIASVFMGANQVCVSRVEGDARAALLNPINDHMQKGRGTARARVEATE